MHDLEAVLIVVVDCVLHHRHKETSASPKVFQNLDLVIISLLPYIGR